VSDKNGLCRFDIMYWKHYKIQFSRICAWCGNGFHETA